MVVRKRTLLWDYTNTRDCPNSINQLDFSGPFKAVSNWNAWIPPELKQRLPFRPMVRTPAQLGGDEWSWLANGAFPYNMVHFFNEPERQNITPAQAAQQWRAHMVGELRAKHGKKLVGPSCASDPAGVKWLVEFMALVHDCPPDFVGVHWYGVDAAAAKKFLNARPTQFGRPLIVSEIASTSRDAGAVDRFAVEMANWMDGQAWIEEYGFFGCMRHVADGFVSPAAQLMDEKGNFTPLMKKLNVEQPLK